MAEKLIKGSLLFTAVGKLVAGALTLTQNGLNPSLTHWFAAVEYYNSADGEASDQVVPTAGTEVFTVKTPVKPNEFQTITNGSINSADQEQADWGSPSTSVRCVLASVAGNGATHARLRVWGASS